MSPPLLLVDALPPEADAPSARIAATDGAPAPTRRIAAPTPAARYDLETAARRNAVLLAAPAASVRLAGLEMRLDLDAARDRLMRATSRIELKLGGLDVALLLGPRTTHHLAAAAGAEGPIVAALLADPELAALAALAVAEPLLARIERAAGATVDCSAWRALEGGAGGAPLPGEGDLLWRVDGLAGGLERIRLRAPEPTLAFLLAELARAAVGRSAPGVDAALRLPATVRLPTTLMSGRELAALGVGDVVFDRFSRAELELCVCQSRWACALEEDATVTIAAAADQEDAAREAAPDAADLAEAELTVSFELARTTLPLSVARRLAPGYVVQLDREVSAEVDILVSNRRFGRGRLVEIDGEIGVEVTKIG